MTFLLLQYHWLKILRYFQTQRLAKWITAGIFLLVFAGVAAGIFVFLKASFQFMVSDPFLRSALPLYVYELFLLIITYLVFASALITGLFQLFKAGDDGWIMASPKFRFMPFYAYARVFVSSFWPLLVIALPALVAMRKVFAVAQFNLLIAFISVSVLIAFTVCIALVVLLGMGIVLRFFHRKGASSGLLLGRLIAAVSVLFIACSYVAWQQSATADVLELFDLHDMKAEVAGVKVILERFGIFPSHLSALTLFAAQENQQSGAIVTMGKLLVLFLLSFSVFVFLSRWYLPLWQSLQEGRFEARTRVADGHTLKSFPRFFKTPIGAVFEKEALMLVRNARDLMWIGFLLSVWFAQTALNFFLKNNMVKYRVRPESVPDIIQALQIVAVAYFISAFALRFAFPAFSVERKTAWIIATSPIAISRIFWGKFFFYGAAFTVLGVSVGLINSAIVGISFASAVLFLAYIILSIAAITALGLGLGALFPNFETDDPAVLTTTLPGLVFIFGSLAYGAAGALSLYHYLTVVSLVPLVLFGIGSLCIIVLSLYLAPRSLERIEFAV
ncbi:MAG: hypothetical protein A2939_00925 [Parcubacteria group bacterium RIFCSPLOWO2_01_FULL_48_18]|nr:MAG: hypothetical protein A3J67_04810 [Parcubacteria group bacterium RIFCSPHIGHO2_02_FULL_48_10b]OHB22037.1 MAG: hypothetical protein A2939_00925 [Parcubacteria group bacterium RIFCSPLOWO2_01_FULL_48_18]